jgi:hypothetical protein
MKQLIIAAVLAALSLPGSVYAACQVDIDMGTKKITNASMSVLGTSSEVATKAYVDNLMAGTMPILEVSAQQAAGNMGVATTTCAAMVSADANRPWRLPTLPELLLAASTIEIAGAASNTTALWTRTRFTAENQWISSDLATHSWAGATGQASKNFRCVR